MVGRGFLGLALAALVPFWAVKATAAELVVSAAASLTDALRGCGRAFDEAHPGTKVLFNFGASGDLAAQIEAGAPVDVFVGAALKEMDRLAAAHRIDPATRRLFATNRLVVVLPARSPLQPASLGDLAMPALGRIAIGNPATVPAGRYAEQALKKEAVLARILTRLVFAENARQVLDWVTRGEVDAGLLYVTDAATRPKETRVAFEVPAGSHEPIVYPIAVVVSASDPPSARSFVSFVASRDCGEILARYGFGPSPER